MSEGDLGADRVALAELEVGDRLLGLGDDRLLAGDHAEVLQRAFAQRGLRAGCADAHVPDDLLEPGNLHDVPEAARLLERGTDLVVVPRLEARHGVCAGGRAHGICPSPFLQTRVLVPSVSTLSPTRGGFEHAGPRSATLATGIGLSSSMMPPCMAARVARGGFSERFTPSPTRAEA